MDYIYASKREAAIAFFKRVDFIFMCFLCFNSPESIKNRSDVFYLVPERSCVPDSPVWYSAVSLGLEAMARMLNRLRVIREIQESQLTSLAVPYYN